MPEQGRCVFRTNGKECLRRLDNRFFCDEHKAVFALLDNPTLIEQTARAMGGMTYVSTDKKITAKADPELIDAVINPFHELLGRGYSFDEAEAAIGDVLQLKGILDDQLKEIGKDPKWKKFEKIVAGIHMLKFQGADVKFDDHIIGQKSKRRRQVDVSVRFMHGMYEYLTIVECKDSTRKVGIKEVEAFSKKREDLGAIHGVLVSSKGFQKGAIETAKFDRIELFTLKEMKSDWTKSIKATVFTLPYPESVEFDYPYFEPAPLTQEPILMKYGDIIFYDSDKSVVLLTDIIWKAARYLVKKKLPLPQRARIPFEPPLLYQFPNTTFYTPIHALVINFQPSNFAFGYEIDMPPKLINYHYSDIDQKNVHEFPVKAIPKIEKQKPSTKRRRTRKG